MKKHVYLFELDSVRNTDREIELGLKALYNEITWNGNVVVLTFNQLVDSMLFFSLLSDEEYYRNFVRLFEIGAMRISQYGDIRTVSQYLLDNLESEKHFIYSGWPLKYTQRRLIALIKRSLVYSDLSEIDRWLNVDGELVRKELFVEVEDPPEDKTEYKDDDLMHETGFTPERCLQILKHLYGLIKTVLRLSEMHGVYVSPKDPALCANRKLPDFLAFIEALAIQEDDFSSTVRMLGKRLGKQAYLDNDERKALKGFDSSEASRLFNEAISIIKNTDSFKREIKSADRSTYVRDLFKSFENKPNSVKLAYQFAEAIVNLAYNYVCEASIRDVSKHYDEDELDQAADERPSFKSDFLARLVRDFWLAGDRDSRFVCGESAIFEKFRDERLSCKFNSRFLGFSLLRIAVHFAKYAGKWSGQEGDKYEPRYEFNLTRLISGASEHKGIMLLNLFRIVIMTLMSFASVCGVELAFQWIQGCRWVDSVLGNRLGYVLGFIIATQFLTQCIAFVWNKIPFFKRHDIKFLSLAEALEQIVRIIFVDLAFVLWHLFFSPKVYANVCRAAKMDGGEAKREKSSRHLFVQSNPMKKYMGMIGKKGNARHFTASNIYPLSISSPDRLATENMRTIEMLCKLEEMYGYRFGVVYESRFNRLVVDPIRKQGGGIFPYERVIPAKGDGVVVITICNGKFVLLRQYRHALRREMLAFPRGYAEENVCEKRNVTKELAEELNVREEDVVTQEMIGRVAPDSGILATRASVWLVRINRYDIAKGHEGIVDAIELSDGELRQCINKGEIEDGFTLAAYALYNMGKGIVPALA